MSMNLNQLISLEGITDYCILWFGITAIDKFMDDNGPDCRYVKNVKIETPK